MGQVARHVRVTGRVQGVFFRAWTRDQARRLGVAGWVHNCADGSLEAHVEGDQDQVRLLIDMIGNGPPGARVDNVHAREAALEALAGFEVRD
jgi:acylphosphatase